MKAKKGAVVTKVRVSLADVANPHARAQLAAQADPAGKAEYAKRWASAAPADPLALQWFANVVPKADARRVPEAPPETDARSWSSGTAPTRPPPSTARTWSTSTATSPTAPAATRTPCTCSPGRSTPARPRSC